MSRKLYTKNGLLYRDRKPLSVLEADREARNCGLMYAEELVKRLEELREQFFDEYHEWLVNLGWTPPPSK
jgi:hypothetical protein